ncbi:VanZ family protein [Polaribacter sp. BAL334]|nr:VanZ family protein [Polaribacter sp. BAL334]
MLRRIKNLLKDKLVLIAIVITLVILGLSLIKMPETGVNVANIDKVYHSFAYFTLTIVWLLSFYKIPQKKHLVTLSCIIFGIIIEVLQTVLTEHRTGDILDVFANSLGSLLALFVFSMIFKKKQIN